VGDFDRNRDSPAWSRVGLAETAAGCASDGPVFDALGDSVAAEILTIFEVETNDFDIGNFELQ